MKRLDTIERLYAEGKIDEAGYERLSLEWLKETFDEMYQKFMWWRAEDAIERCIKDWEEHGDITHAEAKALREHNAAKKKAAQAVYG